MARIVQVDITGAKKARDLYEAVHRVLMERLVPPHEVSIEAWNALLEAHDAWVRFVLDDGEGTVLAQWNALLEAHDAWVRPESQD